MIAGVNKTRRMIFFFLFFTAFRHTESKVNDSRKEKDRKQEERKRIKDLRGKERGAGTPKKTEDRTD